MATIPPVNKKSKEEKKRKRKRKAINGKITLIKDGQHRLKNTHQEGIIKNINRNDKIAYLDDNEMEKIL